MKESFSSKYADRYVSPTHSFFEITGFSFFETEEKDEIYFINALGVRPEDIKIEVSRENLSTRKLITVVGETKNDLLREIFSVNMSFYVRKPLKGIYKSFENGLVILELIYKKENDYEFF